MAAENARLRAEIERLEQLIAERGARTLSTNERGEAAGNEAYYAAFFENSPNDLFVLDVCEDGRFVFEQVNPMVTKSTGYTRDMLVGKTPQQALTPANSSRLAEKYRECVETRQRIEYEVAGVAPIGEVVRRTVLVPIIDAAGNVHKILGTSTDLTVLRRTEQALFQAQKMEAVGQLTRGFAHDFNNLLTTIIGNLEMLIGRMRGARERTLVGAALQAAERGADLTSRLLAFARRQPLQPEPINLNQALANLADMLRSALGGLISVEIELTPGAPAALVDSKHLELALLNLAINARDAMPDGGTLRITTSRETVGPPFRLEHPPAGDYVVISVADTGAGIAPELLGRIFEPFFTTKEPGRGSGLGLSQALGFVQQSGGGITVDSSPGQGTTVRLYLPPAQEKASETRIAKIASPVGSSISARPLSVLLVDDDAGVRDVTAALIESLGHRVIRADTGMAALDILAQGADFDAAVIDYAMPGMNGVELAERVRERRAELPILFITGFTEPDRVNGLHALGIVLHKPFKAADLATKLAQITGFSAHAAGQP
ncbi:MAG: response regulator [Alphaproteobacteria bacterium]|nr:response regulator [Alphaproteobacteria bacterium]